MVISIFEGLAKWMHDLLFSSDEYIHDDYGESLLLFSLFFITAAAILCLIIYMVYSWIDYSKAELIEMAGKIIDKRYVGEYNSSGIGTTVTSNSDGGTGVGIISTSSHSDEKFLLFVKENKVYEIATDMQQFYSCNVGDKIKFSVMIGHYSKKRLRSKNYLTMSKESFVWDDSLVAEYSRQKLSGDYLTMEEFKLSKTPKKEWEIVSVTQGFGSYVDVDKDGKVRYAHFSDCSIEDALQNRGYKIRSVRRISDMEVFAVGDYLCELGMNSDEISKITSIQFLNGTICLNHESGGSIAIMYAKKLPPQPKPEQPKRETVLETAIRLKEECVKAHEFETASNWRQIERLITGLPPIGSFIDNLKLFSESQLREAEEKAFWAARLAADEHSGTIRYHDGSGCYYYNRKFTTFQDYLNSKTTSK